MKTYGTYLGDSMETGDRWIHTIRASELIRDTFTAVRLKRELDQGTKDAVDDDPRVVSKVALATPEQVIRAVDAAHEALPGWASLPSDHRVDFVIAVNAAIRERKEEFVEALITEGHPRRLAEWEVAGVIQGCSKEMMDLSRKMLRTDLQTCGRRTYWTRKPDGVITLVPPKNASASNSLLGLPALAGGNTLVVKAPRSGPYATLWVWAEIVLETLRKFDAPPGTVNVVCASPQRSIEDWLQNPKVATIFYFGDSKRGLKLGQRASAAGKKTVLELSGNDSLVVWKDADLDGAAAAAAECFYGSAQICMVPKRVIVHPSIAEEFIAKLTKKVSEIKPGYPEDAAGLLSPVLHTTEYFELLDECTSLGAKVLSGGRRIDVNGQPDELGVFIEPTVVKMSSTPATRSARVITDETFYPLLPVLVSEEPDDAAVLEEMIEFVNANEYGLRNSFWVIAENIKSTFMTQITNGGILKINDSHIGFAPMMPTHGGTGLTGGEFGEANLPLIRTTHLQAITDASDALPLERAQLV